MAKIITLKEDVLQTYSINKDWILKHTFTSEDAYNVLQFNTAVAWIRYHIIKDDDVINRILAHPLFKVWWINQWNIRQEGFVSENLLRVVYGIDPKVLKDEWLKVNQPDRIKMQAPLKMLDDVLAEVKAQLEKEVRNA